MTIINATLIVQLFHFSLAFFLIKYLLFKPVLAQIDQESCLHDSLITTVQSHQQVVTQREREIAQHWAALRQYAQRHAPAISFATRASATIPEVMPYASFSEQEIKKTVDAIAQEMVARVQHVR